MKNFIKSFIKPILLITNRIFDRIFLNPKIKLKKTIKYFERIGWNYNISEIRINRSFATRRIYYFSNSDCQEEDYTAELIRSKIKGKFCIFNLNIILRKESIDFIIPDYIKGLSITNNHEALKLLLEFNSAKNNFGSFGYNEETNCITYMIIYPSFKSTVPFCQFWHCLINLLTYADFYYPQIMEKLKAVNEKGTEQQSK